MKTIFYSISLGVFCRNLLRTGVMDRLLQDGDTRIVLLSPAYRDDKFVKEFSREGKVFFEKLYPANQHFNLAERVLFKICSVFGRKFYVKGLFLFFMGVVDNYYKIFTNRYYTEVFLKYKPDLVVTGSPGNTSAMDTLVVREAKYMKIPTLCLVHSWDNICGLKGIMPTRPDRLGVWNNMQEEEAVKINFYEPSRVDIVGPPHFDIYQNNDVFMEREVFLKKIGLDPSKKLITVVVGSTKSSESAFILDIILDGMERGLFPFAAQLLVRLHPRVKPEKNKKDFAKYENNPLVKIDYPCNYDEYLKWNPDWPEMVHLANMLKHSDVMVNIHCTVTIEAAILDVPVINLGFSLSDPDKFKERVVLGHWKHHYRYVLERDCVYLAKDSDDLIKGIKDYIDNPGLHRDARKAMATDLCYKLDGKSVERIYLLINKLISRL